MPFGGRNRDPCPFHSLQKIGCENLAAKAIATKSWADLHPTVCIMELKFAMQMYGKWSNTDQLKRINWNGRLMLKSSFS